MYMRAHSLIATLDGKLMESDISFHAISFVSLTNLCVRERERGPPSHIFPTSQPPRRYIHTEHTPFHRLQPPETSSNVHVRSRIHRKRSRRRPLANQSINLAVGRQSSSSSSKWTQQQNTYKLGIEYGNTIDIFISFFFCNAGSERAVRFTMHHLL